VKYIYLGRKKGCLFKLDEVADELNDDCDTQEQMFNRSIRQAISTRVRSYNIHTLQNVYNLHVVLTR